MSLWQSRWVGLVARAEAELEELAERRDERGPPHPLLGLG